VCLILLQKTYAELLTYETAILDGTISAGSLPLNEPTGGVAKDAFVAVRQWAQWFEEAGASTSTGPSVWEPALKAEILARFAQAIRSSEYGALVNDASRQLQTAIDTYAVNDFSDATQMFGVAALSPQRVRLFVIRNCVRRRPRFMPPVAEVDAALKWAMRQLSSRGAWQFRIRDITIAIPTSSGGSSPSITGLASGETFKAILTNSLHYVDSTGVYAGETIDWASPDDYAALRAIHGSTTGRPQVFRIETRSGPTPYWQFSPRPDQAYTVQALALIGPPTLQTAASDTTAMVRFPDEFESLIPTLVLAKILRDNGKPGWEVSWNQAQAEIDKWAQFYSKTAEGESDNSPRDVYGDRFEQSSVGM